MKLKYIIMGALALSMSVSMVSCDDYLDINEDPNTPALTTVSVSKLLPWVQFHLGYATGAHGYRSQFICGAFTASSRTHRDGCSAQWEPTASLSTTSYQQFFVGSGPSVMQMYNKAKETGATHYAAAAQVLRSYGFLMMVDMYGEMPYFEAVSGSVHPTYDTGETIYTECLKNIDEAIELFNTPQKPGSPELSEGDSWNGGDVNKWLKMAYLLKARTLNQLSKKSKLYDPDLILACVEKAQTSIDDDTYILQEDVKTTSKDFISTDPVNTNWNWNQTYNGNRHITLPTKWLEDILVNFDNKGIEDPRADKIIAWRQFNVNGVKTWIRGKGVDMSTDIRMPNGMSNFIARKADGSGWEPSIESRAGDSIYVGTYSGSVGVYGTASVIYDRGTVGWGQSSGNVFIRPNSPYLWATYSEAQFIKAEVLFKKGDKAGAFQAYKNGIKASIDEINKMLTTWTGSPYDECPSFGQMGQTKIDAFMNGAIGTAADITMEKIMTQKFIAMLYSTQNWNDMRRHDYKDYMGWALPYEYYNNPSALRGIPKGQMWRRIKQCSHEINYNETQLRAIQPRFNDDDVWTIPVWWDIPE